MRLICLKGDFNDGVWNLPFCLFYRLDSLSAFFQYSQEFLLLIGSQHGDASLLEVGNALEDRGGG